MSAESSTAMRDLASIPARVRGPMPMPGLPARYAPRPSGPPPDLCLASNEGAPLRSVRCAAPSPATYPDARELEAALAARHGLAPEQALVTAGADDGLLRVALAYVGRGRVMVVPTPTFEMLPRYVALAGGEARDVPWSGGAFPTEAVLAAARCADAVAVVSPNNPTGAVATRADVDRIAAGAPHALVVIDAAYAEFAREDLTAAALAHPNAVVLRTFSKAYGAASWRVGYALGPAPVIAALRAAGNPYPTSGASLAFALAALGEAAQAEVRANVAATLAAREELAETLRRAGAYVEPSEANFVLARVRDPELLRDLAAGLGVDVRTFPGRPGLTDAVRITAPAAPADLARACHALGAALAPDALVFDLDGVLADVSRSYRAAILATAATFGARVTARDVQAVKDAGDANDDWALTHRLVVAAGIDASLAEVTARFEALYQGSGDTPGLFASEGLMLPRAALARLRLRLPLAIVTGRPRSDASRFLAQHGVADLFDAVVTREDAPLKPDPAPVRLALARLGVRRAWFIGDTPDDVRAARGAGVVPLGVLADPASTAGPALIDAGAARVLGDVREVEALVP